MALRSRLQPYRGRASSASRLRDRSFCAAAAGRAARGKAPMSAISSSSKRGHRCRRQGQPPDLYRGCTSARRRISAPAQSPAIMTAIKKHKTDIGAGAFIGSNSSLVAPVTIGDGAYISARVASSTRDVPGGALGVRAPAASHSAKTGRGRMHARRQAAARRRLKGDRRESIRPTRRRPTGGRAAKGVRKGPSICISLIYGCINM